MWVIYIVAAAALVLALVTDDAVRVFLKLGEQDYYALLIAIASAIILGGILQWLIGG
jgi:membrane protein YqaA with SNARE-associated domain